ncbi:MAG: ATP-binding cassette domain-containing protein, partial [Betaproteobacteria bacterium]|nr:ATP-binding cassette domain-containing protein [Betaproteobacteria bacterium]
MGSRLVVEGLEAGYGAVRVLHGVSISVAHGESVVLLGSNGNGKSTLIKCIMGIVSPSGGTIHLERDGERIDLRGKSPQ